MPFIMLKKSKAFSLLEIALVIFIMGVVVSGGITVFTMFYKKSKINETKNLIDSVTESLISIASSNRRLPPVDQTNPNASILPTNIETRQDSFLKFIRYIPADEITNNNSDICNRRTTNLAVILCRDVNCQNREIVDNIAFFLVSGGWNKNIQVNLNEPVTINGIQKRGIRIHFPDTDQDSYSYQSNNLPALNDPSIQQEFDDIYRYITLEQLRVKIGCQRSQLQILTTNLPTAYQNQPYSAVVEAEGGVPYGTGGRYRWSYSLPSSLANALTISPISGNQRDSLLISANSINLCAGNYSPIRITVQDSDGNSYTRDFFLSVQPDGFIVAPQTGTWYAVVGSSTNISIPISLAGGIQPYSVSTCPQSCNGLSVTCSASSISITGTPTAASTCNFSVKYKDGCNKETIATFTVIASASSSGGSSGGGSSGGGSSGGCDPNRTIKVYNNTGNRRDFKLPDGRCLTVNNGALVDQILSGTVGNVELYSSSNGRCRGQRISYTDYSWMRDRDTDCDGEVNYNADGSITDR